MRYYFHIRNGKTSFDEEGMELSSLEAVRQEAIISSAEMVRGLGGAQFWSGEPWMLRVTDQPNGGGETILAITFASAAH